MRIVYCNIKGEEEEMSTVNTHEEMTNNYVKTIAELLNASTELIQYYHEETSHGSHYIHKSICWNMKDLERLTKACKKNKCAFVMRNEHSVYVFRDD